jgi:hypothetical protein
VHQFDVIIVGYEDASDVAASVTDLQAFLSDSGAGGFTANLNAEISFATAGLSVSGVEVGQVTAADATGAADVALDFSCVLSPRMDLRWSVDHAAGNGVGGVTFQVVASEGANGWLGLGLVAASSTEMVTTPMHRVFMYAVGSLPGIYRLNDYYPTYQTDTEARSDTYVDGVFASSDATGLTVVLSAATGAVGDVPLDVNGTNKVIFASGKAGWVQHAHDGRGFANVQWSAGTCNVSDVKAKGWAFLAFAVPLLCVIGHILLCLCQMVCVFSSSVCVSAALCTLVL